MKYVTLAFFIMISAASAFFFSKTKTQPAYDLKSGDIVFQDTGGEQGEAVKAATKSPYTHCGVILEENGRLYVFEALEPVRVTPLKEWRQRSKLFYAMRLKSPEKLNAAVFKKAHTWAKKQIGKHYDLKFQWGNDSLYCSELVWKVYQEAAGITLCEPKRFQDYFLEDPKVRKIIARRYGPEAELPKNEPVVAPSDLAQSPLLSEVPRIPKKR